MIYNLQDIDAFKLKKKFAVKYSYNMMDIATAPPHKLERMGYETSRFAHPALLWDDHQECVNYLSMSSIKPVTTIGPKEKLLFKSSSFPATLLSRSTTPFNRTVKTGPDTIIVIDSTPQWFVSSSAGSIQILIETDDGIYYKQTASIDQEYFNRIKTAATGRGWKCYCYYEDLDTKKLETVNLLSQCNKYMLTDQWVQLFMPHLDPINESDFKTYMNMLASPNSENRIMALNLLTYFDLRPYLMQLRSAVYNMTTVEQNTLLNTNNAAWKWLSFILRITPQIYRTSFLNYMLMTKDLPLYSSIIQNQLSEIIAEYIIEDASVKYKDALNYMHKKIILVDDEVGTTESSNREVETA